MKNTVHLLSAFAVMLSVFVTPRVIYAEKTPITPQQPAATGKLCATDAVEELLPPPVSTSDNSSLSYLKQQGFTLQSDGSWVCYVRDPNQEGRYFTLFKVQQIGDKLVGSSFLNGGSLIPGQDERTVELFLTLLAKHTETTDSNRQSIRRYLEAFVSLVEQGKIQPSTRSYLFDQPHRGIVFYYPLSQGTLKGTAIAINFDTSAK